MASLRRRESGLAIREVNGEVLVLDTESDKIHQLNRTASFIWHKCGEVESEADIAALLASEFDVEEHIALKDVAETLIRLRALKLIM